MCIDSLVHEKLYSYGLQFSNDWAVPYWTTIGTIFALGWVTVGTGIVTSIFLAPQKQEKQDSRERQWSIYNLRDGSTVRVKHVLKSVRQLPNYAPDGGTNVCRNVRLHRSGRRFSRKFGETNGRTGVKPFFLTSFSINRCGFLTTGLFI